jgi:hypothetical protein
MGISSIDSRALAAPNLKDRPRTLAAQNSLGGAWRYGGQYAQEGKLTLALQWIVRSGRTFLRYRLLLLSQE